MKFKVIDHNIPTPSVYSLKINLKFKSSIGTDIIRLKIEHVLEEIADELHKQGCKLIGHIKAQLDAGPGGNYFFSITEFATRTKTKGRTISRIQTAIIKINVIVYHVSNEKLKRIVENYFNEERINSNDN